MAAPTDEQKQQALLHATVWERAFHAAQENAARPVGIDPSVMMTLATFALIVGVAYRNVANGAKIDE